MGAVCSSSDKAVESGAIAAVVNAKSVAKNAKKNNNLSDANGITVKDDDDGVGSLGSSNSDEQSRPPTPFSRPLTGRVAQRPRTTTIFERESDAKKAAKESSARSLKKSASGSLLTVDPPAPPDSMSDSPLPASVPSPVDEPKPPPLSARVKMADEEEIEKLKEFLREKGL